jgi:hypothetical protein
MDNIDSLLSSIYVQFNIGHCSPYQNVTAYFYGDIKICYMCEELFICIHSHVTFSLFQLSLQ